MKTKEVVPRRWQKSFTIEVRDRTVILLAAALVVFSAFVAGATVAGTGSRWNGNQLVFDGSSGNDAFKFDVDGLRAHFGTGSNDTVESNGTYLKVGPTANGYFASQNTRIVPVYVNNVILAATYGGDVLDAQASTVNAIRFYVRTNSIGGDGGVSGTNTNFRIQDSSGAFCNCAFDCYQDTDGGPGGSKRITCSGDAGTGCAFPASAIRTYGFSSVGDCSTQVDISGNLEIEEVPQ